MDKTEIMCFKRDFDRLRLAMKYKSRDKAFRYAGAISGMACILAMQEKITFQQATAICQAADRILFGISGF